MAFQLLTLQFTDKITVRINNAPRTVDYGKKSFCFLYIGDAMVETSKGSSEHMVGFISSPTAIPNPNVIKNNYKIIKNMDMNSQIKWFQETLGVPDLKIPKDKVVDRLKGDANRPIKIWNAGPSNMCENWG